MNTPVNLDNLHDMTDGDKALEKELFQTFINSSDTCLAALKACLAAGTEQDWRAQVHALKGMSFNLGAEKLGQLCAEAQAAFEAAPEKREQMLAEIQKEYEIVKQFLLKQ